MKLRVQIAEINYGDVAVKAMPLLRRAAQNYDGAVGKTIEAISQLPEELIHSIFDAIPAGQKNKIVTAFVMEYQEKVLGAVNKMAEEYRLGVTLSDLAVDKNLELAATIDRVDYLCLVDRFLPMVKEKLLAMGGMVALLRPVIEKASADQICGLLDRFVGDKKDELLAALINQNQETLISVIEDAAGKQNVHLKTNSIFVQA